MTDALAEVFMTRSDEAMKLILTVTCCALALSGAALPAAAAPPQDVTISSTFVAVGDLTAGTTTGTFSISGAITDGGALTGDYRFAGLGHLKTGSPNAIDADQTLAGEQGAISIAIVGLYGPFVDGVTTGEGRWVIVGGTGAYEDLNGEGTWTATADFRAAFAGAGPPVVVHTDTGQVHIRA
jgi:hypothetical protein